MASFGEIVLIPIEDIDQSGRYREHPEKNIDMLATSINDVGLLHPIVVLASNGNGRYPLVVGQRRILACQQLGYDVIESRIATDMPEAERLLAEHDENVCRERMTPSEALACANARKELLAPLAEERKAEGRKRGGASTAAKAKGKASAKVGTKPPRQKSNEAAAAGTGYSPETLRKIAEIESIASNPLVPESNREQVRKWLEELNAAEKPKVHPVWVKATGILKAATASEPEPAQPEPVPAGLGQRKALDDAHAAVKKHFSALAKAFAGADNFDADMTREDAEAFLTDVRKMTAAFAKAVKNVGA